MGEFGIVDADTIHSGGCTDIYFLRTEEALSAEGMNPSVVMEVTASALPRDWAALSGVNDVASLFEGRPVDVDAMPEGSVFMPGEPVVRISGKFLDICRFETALLGFLCPASGIATAAAAICMTAKGVPVSSFGSRRQHPAIARMIERSAWIGGVDGVSNISAPEGIPVVGTMPHSMVISYPSAEEAWASFDRNAPADVPRIFLCDTWCDEKREALAAASTGAAAVRLDTPRSRRGDMRSILEEVRWELDLHGYKDVGIFLSGGVTEEDVEACREIVDGFGIGGAIAGAPVIDFSLDIVEIDGKAVSKRGKKSGSKQVYRNMEGERLILPASAPPPRDAVALLAPLICGGERKNECAMAEARARLKEEMAQISG